MGGRRGGDDRAAAIGANRGKKLPMSLLLRDFWEKIDPAPPRGELEMLDKFPRPG